MSSLYVSYHCLSTPILGNKSPLEKLYNIIALLTMSSLYVSLCYSNLHSGYHCIHIPRGWIYVSKHVIIDQSSFPFVSKCNVESHSPRPTAPMTHIKQTTL